jgi:Ca2+-binding EF-hand superfamily protein
MGGAKGNEKDPFSDIDTDSDGSLSESELTTFADTMSEMTGETQDVSALMDKLDTDGSGTISSDEFKAGKPEGPPPGGMPPGGMAGNGMQDLFQTSDSSSSSTTDLFSSMDTDGDGNVSGDEFKVGIENLVNTFLNQTYSASSSTSGSVLSLEA